MRRVPFRRDEASADHRHHRSGRPAPGRVPRRQGLPGVRPRPGPEQPQGPARAGGEPRPRAGRGRPPGPVVAHRRGRAGAARRGLQPRRDQLRRSCRSSSPSSPPTSPASACCACSRRSGSSAAPRTTRSASTRRRRRRCSARCARRRRPRDAVPPALAVRRRQGVRPRHDGELPRVVRHCTRRRGSASTTRARGAASSSSPARSPTAWRASSSGSRRRSRLGNLDSGRDWGYAGDYVEAMWLMLQQDEPDDYVIATGRDAHRTASCSTSRSASPASTTGSRYVVQDPRFMRPAEVDLLIGDATKAHDAARLEAAGRRSRSSCR